MAKELAVNTALLDRDSDEMGRLLHRIVREVDGMYDAVRELGTTWEGPASEMFSRQFETDYEGTKAFCRTIGELIRCLEQSSRDYARTERRVADAVSSVRL